MSRTVFICHSTKNKAVAEEIVSFFERNGMPCWIAPRDIEGSHMWGGAIIDAISSSRALLLLFSEEANESPHVLREVERAVHKRLPIIPLRLSSVSPCPDLEYFISACQWVDRNEEDPQTAYRAILDSLMSGRITSQPTVQRSSSLWRVTEGLSNVFARLYLRSNRGESPSFLGTILGRLRQQMNPVRLVLSASLLAFGLHLFSSDQGKRLLASAGFSKHPVVTVEGPQSGTTVLRELLTYTWLLPSGTEGTQVEVERVDQSGTTASTIVSGTNLVETELQGTLRWRVRSVLTEDGEKSFGPWSITRTVTYYRNELERVIQTRTLRLKVVSSIQDPLVQTALADQAKPILEQALSRILNSRSISQLPRVEFLEASNSSVEHDAELTLSYGSGQKVRNYFEESLVALGVSIVTSQDLGALRSLKDVRAKGLFKLVGTVDSPLTSPVAEHVATYLSLPSPQRFPSTSNKEELIDSLVSGAIDGLIVDDSYAASLIETANRSKGIALARRPLSKAELGGIELPVARLRIPYASAHLGEVLLKRLSS